MLTVVQDQDHPRKSTWAPCVVTTVSLGVVHPERGNDGHENDRFWDGVPSGGIALDCVNEEAAAGFALGDEFTVEFRKVEIRSDRSSEAEAS